jgi:hypothetical protein
VTSQNLEEEAFMSLSFGVPIPRVPLVPAVLAAGAFLVAPGAAPAQDRDWCRDARDDDFCEVREFTIQTRDGRLEVDAGPNGGIRVEGWSGSDVRVEARVTSRARGTGAAEELARDVEIRAEPGRLFSDGPRTRGRESWSVSFRIQVPVGTDLDLRTTNGGIRVADVRGAVEARTTNGPIRLADVDGHVRLRSTNGPVEASFSRSAALGRDAELRTTNGPVTLVLPESASARVEASTTNGSITTDFPLTIQGRIGRSISGTIGDGGPEIRIRTTNGPVRLRSH